MKKKENLNLKDLKQKSLEQESDNQKLKQELALLKSK
jgi:hypothetical protein